jgi:predicted solute-binding protein
MRLLPRLCVSSEGAVDSIQLVARKPLEQVRTVAVTPESATSVVLTKVLLPEGRARPARRGGRREAADRRRRAQERVRGPDAAPRPRPPLARAHRPADGLRRLGCPEPTRPGCSSSSRRWSSRSSARAEPEQLAYESSERYGYPAGFLARYFEKLRYRFGPRERAGLLTFLELARDVGELDEVPELRFVARAEAAV